MKKTLPALALAALLAACHKPSDALVTPPSATAANSSQHSTQYTIRQGQHYCDGNTYQPIDTGELKFTVVFDSTAIYQTANPVNQYDINKLYGFSDNAAEHHQFSARFGWSWNDHALRLYAYVYNNGVRASKELGIIAIGQEVACSIRAEAGVYRFTMNDHMTTMPRLSTTPKAKGYLLYPYFGGDETAPHTIHIQIKNQ